MEREKRETAKIASLGIVYIVFGDKSLHLGIKLHYLKERSPKSVS